MPLLEDMNWMQVEEYLKHDDRIVVITAACEQHAYLSLLTDVRVPLEVANHANWSEAFAFTRVVPNPGGKKTPPSVSRTASAQQTREGLGDGNYGDLYEVSDMIMHRYLDAAVNAMVTLLRAL